MWTSTHDFPQNYHFLIPTLSIFIQLYPSLTKSIHLYLTSFLYSNFIHLLLRIRSNKFHKLEGCFSWSAKYVVSNGINWKKRKKRNQKSFLKEIGSKNNLKTNPSLDKNSLSFLGPISRYFQPVGIICETWNMRFHQIDHAVRNESRINLATKERAISGQHHVKNIASSLSLFLKPHLFLQQISWIPSLSRLDLTWVQ